MRASLHAAVDARCDALEETISVAETSKAVALEQELCAIDAVLEALSANRNDIAAALVTWGNAGAEAGAGAGDAKDATAQRAAQLAAQLDAAEAQLAALPTCVVEPARIELSSTAVDTALACIASAAHVVAPRGVSVAGMRLEILTTQAWSGHALWLAMHPPPSWQDDEQNRAAMDDLAAKTRVEARLDSDSGPLVTASVRAVTRNNARTSKPKPTHYLMIKVDVPEHDGALHWKIYVAGRPVPLPKELEKPWPIHVCSAVLLCIFCAVHCFLPFFCSCPTYPSCR
jgi:hypothetical protein